MKKIEIKNLNNQLNLIIDEKIKFEDMISSLRNKLEIIEQKGYNEKIYVWLGNRHLSTREEECLKDTFNNYQINNFECIN